MPRDGSGNYSLPSGNPVVPNTTISTTWSNTTLTDIGSSLTQSLSKDGQTTPTADLSMGNFKLRAMANGSLRSDAVNAGQVQDGGLTLLTGIAGANTITASSAPAITAYTSGQNFYFVAAATNTSATVTLNINGLGAKNIYKAGYSGIGPIAIGDLRTGASYHVIYDGTQFQLISPAAQSITTPSFKSVLINGNFDCWGRGTSFAMSAGGVQSAERWIASCGPGGTATAAQLALAPGNDSASPFATNTRYCMAINQTVASPSPSLSHKIESSSTFNGRTATLTFVAFTVSGSNVTIPGVTWTQGFGSGGSSDVTGGTSQACLITASGQEFSITITLPSVAGKTINRANDYLWIFLLMPVSVVYNIAITNIRLVEGSQSIPFEVLPLPVVKAQCERFYEKTYVDNVVPGAVTALGSEIGRTVGSQSIQKAVRFRTRKRAIPTVTVISTSTGGVGKVFDTSGGADVNSVEGAIGDTGFSESAIPGVANATMTFHYVADAEL